MTAKQKAKDALSKIMNDLNRLDRQREPDIRYMGLEVKNVAVDALNEISRYTTTNKLLIPIKVKAVERLKWVIATEPLSPRGVPKWGLS